MVNFGEKSSKKTVIFDDFLLKLTSVHGLKIQYFNRMPSFYSRIRYLLYTTVRCNKYDRNVPGNGTLRNVVEFMTKTFAVQDELQSKNSYNVTNIRLGNFTTVNTLQLTFE